MSHSKAILSADWNEEGNLVTGDENKTLSVTTKKENLYYKMHK